MIDDSRALPHGTGSRPSGRASKAVSPVPASIPSAVAPKTLLYCSFCGKSQEEVLCLIAGPTVFICDECVVICGHIAERYRIVKIIREELEETPLIASAIEARRAETQGGSVADESAVPSEASADAQPQSGAQATACE